jgi:hypothetical protein
VSVRLATIRCASILALCVSLTACAQTPVIQAPGFGVDNLSAVQSASAAPFGDQMQRLGHQTFAGKVLTAIALERVTGLKPDPSRFSDLD